MTEHDMGEMEDLASLLREVLAAFSSIDRYILRSEYVEQNYDGIRDFQSFSPLKAEDSTSYLQDARIFSMWEDYFRHVMQEWDGRPHERHDI